MNSIIINPHREQWPEIIQRPQIESNDLEKTVLEIINTVKQSGDQAVKDYSLKFHGFSPDNLWVSLDEINNAAKAIDKELKKAILLAKKNIEKFHRQQIEKVKKVETSAGVICWRKNVPVQKVGLYIPGGSAPLFSTLLMLAIPAKIAGCKNILVTTPADKSGNVDSTVLFIAHILGIKNIYKGGGAQAIAAMAYGTQTVKKVDKIFGPGNQFVTCAKKLVNMNGVAIDMLAGPSELAVYADDTCIPTFVAADLLSQAEHGADSQVLLVAADESIIEKVINEIHMQLPLLSRKKIIERSFLNRRFLVIEQTKDAFDLLNEYAPEHLIIASKNAEKFSELVKNAGSVFLGNLSPESAGDYASGTNHSLPTNGTSKTYSGVSVDSFVKKITFQKISRKGIKNIGPCVEKMAAAEKLDAHKNAISIRLQKIKK
ncbi:MAG: histidinol dehydrogenase [Bacteroidota bacterium]|nr:histidinol dehydrogenase [Bacteroidota bacterium]